MKQLASSTDTGNTGLNQNYFTQGAVGTQTGPVNLGQPTSFHLALQRCDGHADIHGYDLGAGDLRARQQLHGLAVVGDDQRAEDRLHADLSGRRHARQRRVRATDQLPQRRDADERRVRATDKLPERPSPVSR